MTVGADRRRLASGPGGPHDGRRGPAAPVFERTMETLVPEGRMRSGVVRETTGTSAIQSQTAYGWDGFHASLRDAKVFVVTRNTGATGQCRLL